MPDRDNWTASMVLRWVLSRDEAAVLPMIDTYNTVVVFEDHTVRLDPEDMEAVMIAYCTDPTFLPGEERDVTAVVRSQRVIAAKDEIYQALLRDALKARARRNGSGDVETIASDQWLSLKFQSWNGHDLAVPIDIKRDVLNLPRAFEEYVAGGVPADVLPAVWPDPHFAAHLVMQIWPPQNMEQTAAAVESVVAAPTGAAPQSLPIGGDKPPLRRPTDQRIHDGISAAYDEAVLSGQKPPNLKEISEPVRAILRDQGYEASDRRIQTLAGDKRHNGRRRKPGRTVASENRRQNK